MTSPSKLVAGKFPGATNRYEDFVVLHMQQTLNIHGTVSKPDQLKTKRLLNILGKLPFVAQILHMGLRTDT